MLQIASQTYKLSGIAVTKQGGRPENQDDLGWADTPLGFLLVVCDGMGGGPGGKTASSLAKTEVLTVLLNSSRQASRIDAMKMAISRANDLLYQKMDEVPSLRGMGSTLVAVLVNEQSALIAHLGDSRCYKIRGSHIVYRTQDHSLVGELVRNKALTEEQARVSPQSNVIMRGLGNTSNHAPEIIEVPYRKGDRFLLCTDGVWGIMPHEQLAKRLTSMQDISSLVYNLSEEIDQIGRSSGGHYDNHTMAVIEMKSDSILKEKMDKKTKIIIGILALLLLVSLAFHLTDNSHKRYEAEIETLNQSIADKSEQIKKLEARQKFYNDMNNAGSKALITQVEELQYENDSLKDAIQTQAERLDSLEQVIKKLTEAKKPAQPAPKKKEVKNKKNK